MRASRLLRILLLLQNRGRVTTRQLATELEVARRTVLRDIGALAEAGLPVVVHRGSAGGIELGFNYRIRLTSLAAEEAEALGVILGMPKTFLAPIGLESAAHLACAKLTEALPDIVRQQIRQGQRRFRVAHFVAGTEDARVPALAAAIRASAVLRIRARSGSPRTVHPIALELRPDGWALIDALDPLHPIPLSQCGDINVAARRFEPPPPREPG